MASKRKVNGYWHSLETTLFEVKKVMEEHNLDKFPTQKELIKLGYSSLGNAIREYHGGLNNFREKHLGEELSTKHYGYWKSLENTISESKKVMKEHNLDKFPTQNKLKELGYGGLNTAINRYHGGLLNFRAIMNQELGIKSNKEHLTEVWKKYTGK